MQDKTSKFISYTIYEFISPKTSNGSKKKIKEKQT